MAEIYVMDRKRAYFPHTTLEKENVIRRMLECQLDLQQRTLG